MTFYKVTYKNGHRVYEELFLERDFACDFYASLKRSSDIISYAVLSSVSISPAVLNEENISKWGVVNE